MLLDLRECKTREIELTITTTVKLHASSFTCGITIHCRKRLNLNKEKICLRLILITYVWTFKFR